MAASGSYDYLVTASDIITGALEDIGEYGAGETATAEDAQTCLRTLNMLVKQWQGSNDFAPGLKAWTRKRAYVFLQKDQESYRLGPSGDHATLDYATTTLTAAASAGASTITVATVSGIASTYNIAVELDSGSLQWTTINGAPAGLVVTLTATLTGAASSGNRVFVYQTKLQQRPLEIVTAVIRDSDNVDIPMGLIDLDEYESIGEKTAEGSPADIYYDSQLTNGVMYLGSTPDDVTKVIRAVILSPVDDLDGLTDDIVFPQVWFLALELGLAKYIAPKFKAEWTALLESNFVGALSIARNENPETSSLCFEPGRE